MNRQRGFTLIELIVALLVLAVLISLAAPSFRTIIQNNRLATGTNGLVSALNLARSEAVKRGGTITVVAASTNWNNGWTINVGATTIRTFAAPPAGVTVTNATTTISFVGSGSATVTTFDICDSTRVGETGRRISVAGTGRVSTADLACS
jgi:type IV fimbrial biogenesis protein FimT